MRQILSAVCFSAVLALASCASKSTTASGSCADGKEGCSCSAGQVAKADKNCTCKHGEKCGCDKGKCACKKS